MWSGNSSQYQKVKMQLFIFFYKINIEKSHLFNNNQFLTSLISFFYNATALSDHTNLSDHAPLSDHTGGPDLAVLFQLMIMCSVLISYCVCRRPSWKPKTQPNDSSAVVWLSFGFQLDLLEKNLTTLLVFTFTLENFEDIFYVKIRFL